MLTEQIKNELSVAEKKLYDARTPERERSDLSMQVSLLRGRYARALRVTPWTATAALAAAEIEDEV